VGFACWALVAVGGNVGSEVTGVGELSAWKNSVEEDRSCVHAPMRTEINIIAVKVNIFDRLMNW
jgi:hypothetical protein